MTAHSTFLYFSTRPNRTGSVTPMRPVMPVDRPMAFTLGGFLGEFVANGMMWLYDKFGLVGGGIREEE